MGLFTTKAEDELRKLTLEQLRALATEHGLSDSTEPQGVGEKMWMLKGKDMLVQRLSLSSLREEDITTFKKSWAPRQAASQDGSRGGATTPTLAPTRSAPQVAFHEIVGYLEDYRFISRYDDERLYEVELAGALRERFGIVSRQYPVPNSSATGQNPRVIDLDVAANGIEVKFGLRGTNKPWDDLRAQLESYKQHYAERVIVLLIACDASQDHRVHELREKGYVVITK